jgi:hypothetical protein
MMADGDRIPYAAKAIELGRWGREGSMVVCNFGARGTILTFDVREASESEAASLPSIEVVGVRGGVARVTVGVTGCSGVDD